MSRRIIASVLRARARRFASTFAILLASVLAVIPAAHAQERGHAGDETPERGDGRLALTIASPLALGLLWQLTERFSLRPEFSATHSIGTDLPTSTGLTTAVTALFYVGTDGPTRTYLAPRIQMQRIFSDIGPDEPTWGASLALGVQHAFADTPLMLFAEGGVQSLWVRREIAPGFVRSLTQWSTRAVIGVAWFPGRDSRL